MEGTTYRAGHSLLQVFCQNTCLCIQKQLFQVFIDPAGLITPANSASVLFLGHLEILVHRIHPAQLFSQFLSAAQKSFFLLRKFLPFHQDSGTAFFFPTSVLQFFLQKTDLACVLFSFCPDL